LSRTFSHTPFPNSHTVHQVHKGAYRRVHLHCCLTVFERNACDSGREAVQSLLHTLWTAVSNPKSPPLPSRLRFVLLLQLNRDFAKQAASVRVLLALPFPPESVQRRGCIPPCVPGDESLPHPC
jgi:hypothetical protein